MNSYQNLEDSVYNVIEGLFPQWMAIFAYYNEESQISPYCSIDVQEISMIGREYQSTLATLKPDGSATTVTVQDTMANVSFKIIGLQDHNTETSEMAHMLQMMLRTPKGYELLAKNNLSFHGVTKFPRQIQKRDCDTFMVYELVCKFAYANIITDDVNWIEVTSVQGTYHDAGREPDHIIIGEEIKIYPPYQ